LTSDALNVELYNRFKLEFPFLHLVMYSVVETRYFRESGGVIEASELLPKQRMILFLFYGLIRARSQKLLTHWAIVDPLAHFYRGNSQPGSKSISGSFVSHLNTGLSALEKIIFRIFRATICSNKA
jgi:hypothetical protein